MKNDLVESMLKAGYVVSPNNIYGLRGVLMYAGGPGIKEFSKDLGVEVLSDRIRVYKAKFFGESYSKRSNWDTETVAVFLSTEELLAAAPNVSEGGSAADYMNVWD